MTEAADLRDEFPDTPARRAVVSVVRGFGALTRQMGPHYASFDLTPPQFQMLTIINRLRREQITQRRLGKELYVSFPNVDFSFDPNVCVNVLKFATKPIDSG